MEELNFYQSRLAASLKGIVCPKMKILSVLKIFWRKFVTRLFWGTIDFHSRKKNTMEVNGAPEFNWKTIKKNNIRSVLCLLIYLINPRWKKV